MGIIETILTKTNEYGYSYFLIVASALLSIVLLSSLIYYINKKII